MNTVCICIEHVCVRPRTWTQAQYTHLYFLLCNILRILASMHTPKIKTACILKHSILFYFFVWIDDLTVCIQTVYHHTPSLASTTKDRRNASSTMLAAWPVQPFVTPYEPCCFAEAAAAAGTMGGSISTHVVRCKARGRRGSIEATASVRLGAD